MIGKRIGDLVAGLEGRVIIFRETVPGPDGSLERLLAARDELYLALAGPGGEVERLPREFRERVLDSASVDFTDRIKTITGGAGFENVLVAADSPECIRQALGIAGVLGRVYLFSPPRGRVSADLHNTLLYKSLTVKAAPA